ncbi:NADH-quinone oxidoreductase subunit L [Fervidicoccus fontis]|uniref:NADH-quinone oxidoreductase subunit L n=1 Tax=Fervidicoccus fontis TaxID=683846 RepID=A0A843AIA8_9CREN|nr:proton-conducting transporter membrane subunit [Fervidicoccus fontis]MBE9390721.1 NADH-quinone oxidoreductase subunit L [Fervidicoccus fontis]
MILSQLYFLAVLQIFIFASVIAMLSYSKRFEKVNSSLSIISLTISFLASLALLVDILANRESKVVSLASYPFIGFSLSFIYDPLSVIMMALVSFLSLLIAIYSTNYMKGDEGYNRYFVYFTFFVGSMMTVVSANNLILLFFGWEGTGLASYALIGHWRNDEEERMVGEPNRYVKNTPMFSYPSMSALRAILFTRVPDILMLIAIFILYLYGGSFEINVLMNKAPHILSSLYTSGILGLTMFMLSMGSLAKSAQFPLHEWLVTAMTGPTPVSALIHAATMVKAGVYFMLRISPLFIYGSSELISLGAPNSAGVLSAVHAFYYAIFLIGAVTAFALGSMALVAREAKLILAYSTASQLGYMFAGIGAAAFSSEPSIILTFVLAHLIAHAVFKAGLFLGAGTFIHEGGSRFIDEWPNLYRLKGSMSMMWLLVLSLAGIPPFLGFWTKDALVEGYLSTGLYIPVILLMTTILFTAFYSTRFLLYNYKFNKGSREVEEPPAYVLSTYSILALLSILLGIAWPFIVRGFSTFVTASFSAISSSYSIEIGLPMYVSLTIVVIALLLSLSAYLFNAINSKKVVKKIGPIEGFLSDRWYINVIYHNFGLLVAIIGKAIYRFFEKPYDKLMDVLVPAAGGKISVAFRKLHTGGLYLYIFYFILGALILLLISILW